MGISPTRAHCSSPYPSASSLLFLFNGNYLRSCQRVVHFQIGQRFPFWFNPSGPFLVVVIHLNIEYVHIVAKFEQKTHTQLCPDRQANLVNRRWPGFDRLICEEPYLSEARSCFGA